MSRKLTLALYLDGRGAVKSLTRIEAEAFGVPYPLVSGWPARYENIEITSAMLEDLAQRITSACRSTAKKARRGLASAASGGSYQEPQHIFDDGLGQAAPSVSPVSMSIARVFVIRPSKRIRKRMLRTRMLCTS
jgi:hypothetical protein